MNSRQEAKSMIVYWAPTKYNAEKNGVGHPAELLRQPMTYTTALPLPHWRSLCYLIMRATSTHDIALSPLLLNTENCVCTYTVRERTTILYYYLLLQLLPGSTAQWIDRARFILGSTVRTLLRLWQSQTEIFSTFVQMYECYANSQWIDIAHIFPGNIVRTWLRVFAKVPAASCCLLWRYHVPRGVDPRKTYLRYFMPYTCMLFTFVSGYPYTKIFSIFLCMNVLQISNEQVQHIPHLVVR